MKDIGLCYIASLIVIAYTVYMTVGPGGDGVIFGTIVGAVCLLAGVKYQKNRDTSGTYVENEPETTIEYPVP